MSSKDLLSNIRTKHRETKERTNKTVFGNAMGAVAAAVETEIAERVDGNIAVEPGDLGVDAGIGIAVGGGGGYLLARFTKLRFGAIRGLTTAGATVGNFARIAAERHAETPAQWAVVIGETALTGFSAYASSAAVTSVPQK